METRTRRVVSALTTAEAAQIALERDAAVEGEILQLAIRVVMDPEFNSNYQAARAALAKKAPSSLDDLARALATQKHLLTIRPINRRAVEMAPFQGSEARLLEAILRPVALEVVHREQLPCRPRDFTGSGDAGGLSSLSPDDPGPAEVCEAGFGVLQQAAPVVHLETHGTAAEGPSVNCVTATPSTVFT